jgi:hypothetical protein
MHRVSEAYWEAVLAGGVRVPADAHLPDLTADLVRWLGDPDARRRDSLAYTILATWISEGVYDDLLVGLGDGICSGLSVGLGNDGDDTVLRRSFSALLLAEIIARDNVKILLAADDVMRWGDRTTSWYVREQDLRGYVQGMGWAHAVAHGADLIGQLARNRHLGSMELTALLDVVADRLLAPTRHVWRHAEDDRLAYAVMVIVHRGDVDVEVLETWVRRLGAGIRQPGTRGAAPEWPTPTAVNTTTFLRALHLQLALGVRAQGPLDEHLFAEPPLDRADVMLVLLEQLRSASPWLYRRRSSAPVLTV